MEAKYAELAKHLARRSLEICAQNSCTELEHRCESYAYIREDGALLDICASDFFTGCARAHAAVSLPWAGTAEELREEVAEQCAEMTSA